MAGLADHPVTLKWPPRHPDRLQLYSLPTPNGIKVAVMLEETGLPYEGHRVEFDRHEQYSPEFHLLNPNDRIPAILDPQGPDGVPLPLFESGAILWYLAEKSGQLLPAGAAERLWTLQWLMFQMGNVGPSFGQVGFFNRFAGREWEDKRPLQRYVAEARRLLRVLEERLTGRRWIMGERYTIADVATFPWVNHLVTYYEAAPLVGYDDCPQLRRALQQFLERPAVARGMTALRA
ncbi:MAG: glutathione S-transferase N-terminal domain-containing protein [Gammaproteobacteria bacterium]|nr:glutathione S-transferase N-terminal domain-containing protein [Gammaproteobacteria bacterium]MDE2250842.1 glutathione S-transferase N-terminal domain-containing protein [Gammaproteobacteria bacterium]